MFWALAAVLFGLVAVAICAPVLSARRKTASRAAHDMQVYRDQLAEIERDVTRGVLSAEDADGTRAEIARRLIAAANAERTETPTDRAPKGATVAMAALVCLVLLGGGGVLYTRLGVPGLPDQPLAQRLEADALRRTERPSQAEAEAVVAEARNPAATVNEDDLALVNRLREVLATEERKDDVTGHRLLSVNLGRLGLYAEAREAHSVVLELLGDAAKGTDHIDQAEFMILAANGYVSPEAEAALGRGLSTTPEEPRGRYYSGLALAQAGRPDLTYQLWTRLLREGPPEAPWNQAIAYQLPDVARAAGKPMPDVLSGPSQGDIANAAQMSPEERTEMIRGMVASLSDRLAREGGSPEEWARLIRAYGVLGETGQASDVWNEAQSAFADKPAALNMIRRAAREAEVVQ